MCASEDAPGVSNSAHGAMPVDGFDRLVPHHICVLLQKNG
jgi:hypothetical protein